MSRTVIINRVGQFSAFTAESRKVAEYSVLLSEQPREDVSIVFTSSDLTEGRPQQSTLTFTPANWSEPQQLFIEGIDDYENDGTVAYSITGKVVTNDLGYNRVTVPVINLQNLDDGEDVPLFIRGDRDPEDMVDYIKGQNGNDRLYGGYDQDNLRGGRGDDRLYGEQDDDLLFGELGNDKLYGGYDDDKLDGGEGDDALYGEQGSDSLLGGLGNDVLDGGIEADTMIGGRGNDTYYVDSSGDTLNDQGAATDIDTVIVTQNITYTLAANIENAQSTALGDSNINGNGLNNAISGNDAKNVLDGGSGSDSLAGGGGADSLLGGAGNDELSGGLGNDTMRGGAGVDCADFEKAGINLSVNLLTGVATGQGSDLLFDIEDICSGRGNDTLTGNGGANDIEGGAGRDILNGGVGNDTLTGCAFGSNGGRGEIDRITGGVGADIYELGWANGCYYNDGSNVAAGFGDYAVITDFQVGVDRLILDGAPSSYYFGASVSGVSGRGLYLETGATDELVAVIQSTTTVTVQNTIQVSLFV